MVLIVRWTRSVWDDWKISLFSEHEMVYQTRGGISIILSFWDSFQIIILVKQNLIESECQSVKINLGESFHWRCELGHFWPITLVTILPSYMGGLKGNGIDGYFHVLLTSLVYFKTIITLFLWISKRFNLHSSNH